MPEVGYDKAPIRKELKTAPPDGFVSLRRLPYDEILKRRELATRLSMAGQSNTRRRGRDRQQREEDTKMSIEIAQVATREYEFANCIVDHNLTVDGTPVDFRNPKMAFKLVQPETLQEIELYLSELNMETDEDDLEDFLSVAKLSSSEEESLQSITTDAS
jgi:hypothetical protein